MGLIFPSGSTVVPGILALEALGYEIRIDPNDEATGCRATRDGLTLAGADPVWLLGLIKLAEVRGGYEATDAEIDATLARYFPNAQP